ncbi:CLUMA_CG013207, isoform A [Clunio marinus]|uniref:CLUMA_CG013207, isoform A n=1 Tax=Clunio marinus TaxID=568069 RepID=A0A1J1II79_9DIPT|nr:CLUMA_CG013207, isoform A [Clunio marinus]
MKQNESKTEEKLIFGLVSTRQPTSNKGMKERELIDQFKLKSVVRSSCPTNVLVFQTNSCSNFKLMMIVNEQ